MRLKPFIAAQRTKRPALRRWRAWLRWCWRLVSRIRDTPHRIAWGFAIGMVINWLPIVGGQMLVAMGLSWLLRANVLASVPPVWISNPVTMLPMFWFQNQIGGLMVGKAIGWNDVRAIIGKLGELGIWDGTKYLFTEGWQVFIAVCVGGAIMGVAWALPSYFLVRRVVTAQQVHIRHRREAWAARA